MKYIAYGSNMEQGPMAQRCPHGKLIDMGWLSNMRLEFYVHATVEPAPGERVPVAVWEIDAQDEVALDWYEGYPDYYRKEQHTVQMNDGSEISGMVYIMNENMCRPLPPQKSYYIGIEDAYTRLGLEEHISTVLEPALQRSKTRR